MTAITVGGQGSRMQVRTEARQTPPVDRTERVDHSMWMELLLIGLVVTMGILAAIAIVLPAVVSS
ncbi:hypothetical protein E5720_13875 [Rhodococcus sp. PAMC28707]|uniref:hypothetical protein n=1 Tax=unclassified Rhodococcus (in: high G+C Gram-positive bacteria) TaxID=192944 RepID=UPI00109E0BB4|nr:MULTISPECIES: hypothetical protein [unclassified Rhodococcus (in: high G+C Gram-positive bacteria)]QCB48892.1 hypothetical protein E5769_00140 [Rhodococcus sp. PAMC28705]QCB59421.1 hypothetical protein E5720_13875 [Rhodococcus sp. PAMC28707]